MGDAKTRFAPIPFRTALNEPKTFFGMSCVSSGNERLKSKQLKNRPYQSSKDMNIQIHPNVNLEIDAVHVLSSEVVRKLSDISTGTNLACYHFKPDCPLN